jgi:nucleoside-diphosphate-sugar epimerase
MYASDLSIALWKTLIQGKANLPYNIGSNIPYSLKEIATIFNKNYGNKVKILNLNPNSPQSVYVPNTDLMETDLKIYNFVKIEDAIQKTIDFAKN